MAKVQMTIEELLQLARGDMPVEEIKQQLAKGLLEVWNHPDTQRLIEAEAERLARLKVERIIRDAYQEEKTGSYGRLPKYSGWAIPIIREVLKSEFSIPYVIEALKPEIDTLVQESMGRALASFFINQARKDS